MANGSVVVVGGTQGMGRQLARAYADEGREVIVTGRDHSRAESAAKEIGGNTRGIGFDLCEPHAIAGRLEASTTSTTSFSSRSRATSTRCTSTTSRPRCGSSR